MSADDDPRDPRSREVRTVRLWRFDEARRAGLEPDDAAEFADGDQTLALLRRLRANGATPAQIKRIVT